MDLQGHVAVITGAAGALGGAVARCFADAGATLALLDRDAAPLQAAFGAWPRTTTHAVDLLDAAAVEAAVARIAAAHGRIDVLVNLAGGFRMGEPVHALAATTWDGMIDINVRTLLNTAHAVVPVMLAQGRGRIVNVGAFSAQRGLAQMGAYVAAKSAVIRLTESMAAELRERGINVNCVLPTILDTPANRRSMPDADPAKWVAPADLAAVIAFLASDAARAVHGAAVPVTGLS